MIAISRDVSGLFTIHLLPGTARNDATPKWPAPGRENKERAPAHNDGPRQIHDVG